MSGVIQTFTLHSIFQRTEQLVRVMLPSGYNESTPRRAVYVLPTSAGMPAEHGDPMLILRDLDAATRHGVILVQPLYEIEPWFGDHATDPAVRQASYLRDAVVPFVEERFATTQSAEGRLLFGCSKSGWGAFSLILHDPDFYGYAAAWDAPMMFDQFYYGMGAVFGTQERLDEFRPHLLAAKQAAHFRGRPRLVLAGEKAWGTMIPTAAGGSHTAEYHALLDQHRIAHVYDDTLRCEHKWLAAWMEPVLATLVGLGAR